ncbi:MAG: hypothetical protein QXY40_06635 [Candidatus Methanomethylicia archaeon]
MEKREISLNDKDFECIEEKDLVDYLESLDSNIKNIVSNIEELNKKTEMMQGSLDLAIKMMGSILKKMKIMTLTVRGKESIILENDKNSEIKDKINQILDMLNYIKNQYGINAELKSRASNVSLLFKILKKLRIKSQT